MIARMCPLAWLLSFFAIATSANAQSVPLVNVNPATDFTSGPRGPGQFFGFDENNINGTWGWGFTVTSPIVATDVGWYDKDGDGLSNSHTIGLWQSNGQTPPSYTQLLQTYSPILTQGITIPAGTAAPLDGVYRKAAIFSPFVPFILTPGTYILAGTDSTTSPDVIRYGLDRGNPFFDHTMPTDPRIDLGGPASWQGSGLHVPDTFLLVDGVELGPMLFVVPVPEPTSFALIFTAFCFFSGRRSQRRF